MNHLLASGSPRSLLAAHRVTRMTRTALSDPSRSLSCQGGLFAAVEAELFSTRQRDNL